MMKQIIILIISILSGYMTIASDTTIYFRQIAYSDLFKTAKEENKGVMLYFHFDGCGACHQMENNAFKDKGVIDYYNKNFINFQVNTRKGEGIEVNKLYNIEFHPTFIFFDRNGKELHRLVGEFNPRDFYKKANEAYLSEKNLTNYKKLYREGKREADFLYDYSYMLRDAFEIDSAVANEYLDQVDVKQYSLEKNIRFIYEFCIYNFNIFFPFNNPRFNYILENKNLFFRYLDSNQVKTRIVWILNYAVYKAIEEKDEKTFRQAIEILKEYDNGEAYVFKEMDGRITGVITGKNLVLSSLMRYYEKMGDQKNYQKLLDQYISNIYDDADELNNFAWNIFLSAQDEEIDKLKAAIKCSIRSIALEDNYANNDTYAWLLYKSGDKESALKQANKAIDIAKNENQDYSETQKLVDLIKQKK